MKRSYYILTVQRKGNYSSDTMFYEGSLVAFVLIEMETGNNRSIINSVKITEEEYDHALLVEKRFKENK